MKPTLRNAHWIALLCLMLTAACAALESNNAPANNNAAPAADTANANTPPTLQPAPSLTAVPPATAPAPTATTPPVPATAQPISPTAAKPAAQPAAHVEGPKLVMVSQEHDLDFGKQPQDKALVRPIRIKNGGTQTLNIESVSPSWGCTTVDFPKVLRPGQVGTIRVKVETGKAAGPHTKSVTIRTNDPSETSHVVQFKFDVKG